MKSRALFDSVMLLQAPRNDTKIIGSGPRESATDHLCFSANQRSEHLPDCTRPTITWLRIGTGRGTVAVLKAGLQVIPYEWFHSIIGLQHPKPREAHSVPSTAETLHPASVAWNLAL